ncbi:hypothetical protein [Methylobacterium pseudosasicola]|uniref:hypothetical protein n=1 Tax=Methylobacterium pseudosasicola TaxID=582667 RepID=UPI000A40291B|nr:hypothetical protein [Methylobacterium pseudosasicola]
MDPARLVQTESMLAVTDRLWRAEMRRAFGPDGVLLYGFGTERQGEPGTRLRQAFEARTAAVAGWRNERRRSA